MQERKERKERNERQTANLLISAIHNFEFRDISSLLASHKAFAQSIITQENALRLCQCLSGPRTDAPMWTA